MILDVRVGLILIFFFFEKGINFDLGPSKLKFTKIYALERQFCIFVINDNATTSTCQ